MKRVLFLVDRNNLGKQAEGGFGTMGSLRTVMHSTQSTGFATHEQQIPADSNVIISTIQRLFSFLKGEPIVDDFR